MANEISFSSLTTDARLTQILAKEVEYLLADRFSLRGSPALKYVGDLYGSGSTQIKVPQAGLGGYNRMAAVNEGSATSNVALTTANATVTIARQSLQRNINDLANITDSVGINVPALAADMVASAEMRFMEMVCAITAFTANAGTSGAHLTIDDWFTASFTLTQASVPASLTTAILYPKQVTDLINSVRGESGVVQWLPATGALISQKGQGYAGNFLGVDIYASTLIPTANAAVDSSGMMFGSSGGNGASAILWADGTPAPIVSYGLQIPAGSKIVIEFERLSAYTQTQIVGSYYCGVSKSQNGMGCSLTTVR